MYLDPTLHIHSTFSEAKGFYASYDPYFQLGTKKAVGITQVMQGGRNLIVGEPGVGKTELLKKIQECSIRDGAFALLVNLKDRNAIARIDEFLANSTSQNRALLLDGLDEIQASLFPEVLEKIRDVSRQALVPIYLSSRWVFINRYAGDFSEYRFITISPFTQGQVRKFLIDSGFPAAAVGNFLRRLMSFRHNTLVIQVPRYLSLLSEYLKEHQMDSVERLSRNDLLEYFIHAKLKLEDERLNADKCAITKRLLEKLALTMEIYQANTIRKDELMTFFDDLESDLKVAALSQLDLQVLFAKTLLKDNHDSIEFDNTEFQEYLAAKEITRFADPRRAAFAFAVDPQINEFQPSWFNTLTFLVDMQPGLLEQFAEFSGIRGRKIVGEGFLDFLARVDPTKVAPQLRKALFQDLLEYHQRLLQWMPGTLASSLPWLFDASHEALLKSEVTRANNETGTKRLIPLGNIALIVGYLFDAGAALDRDYWREHLLAFANDGNENTVLQRNALFALEQLADPGIIERLPATLLEGDESIARAFLRLCTAVNPESPLSLKYFVLGTIRQIIEARYGLYALKAKESLKAFLSEFNSDERFRQAFLGEVSVFNDHDQVLIDNIDAVFDDELTGLSEEALLNSFNWTTDLYARQSIFILGLGKLAKVRSNNWFTRFVEIARSRIALYQVQPLLSALIETPADLHQCIAAMVAAGLEGSGFGVLLQIKSSNKLRGEELFEAGRALLPREYQAWDEQVKANETRVSAKQQRLIDDFRMQLEPAPGQYSTGIFASYLNQISQLEPLLSSGDRDRLVELIRGSVFNTVNPANYDLTITDDRGGGATTYTVSSHIQIFRDALLVAKHLGIDTTPFRQSIINYIPFAYSEDLQAIFEMVKSVTLAEFAPVMGVYRDRRSDLWRHMPSNFIDAAELYHITDATPILKAFATEPGLLTYVRQRALGVVESFVADKEFLRTIANTYRGAASPGDREVAETAMALLITGHADAEAIRERLRHVVEHAAPLTMPRGAGVVGRLEDEIIFSKTYAKPLMELRVRGYEQDYLQLLDHAMALWTKGEKFYQYATYLWGIVYAYFNNLKEFGSYGPLQMLEQKIATIKEQEGGNWLAAHMAALRREYLSYLGKPRNIAEAIQLYNAARRYARKEIINSQDLSHHLQDAIEGDLTRWIEAEGAYDLLHTEKVFKTSIQQYEKLVQKTLKSQVENILLKRGFQVDVYREPQLLDEKRPDLLVRYGFAGPVIVEVKLTSNKDLRTTKPKQSTSYANMKQYLEGYGASHGIFLVIDNQRAKNLHMVTEAFAQIPNVWVKVFKCRKDDTTTRTGPQRKPQTRRQPNRKPATDGR